MWAGAVKGTHLPYPGTAVRPTCWFTSLLGAHIHILGAASHPGYRQISPPHTPPTPCHPRGIPDFIFQGLDGSCWSKRSPSQETRAFPLALESIAPTGRDSAVWTR